nr:DUF559 domain-containing protein [uncultured Kingella sp.]
MDYPNDYLTEERLGEIFQIAQPDIAFVHNKFVHNKMVPDSGIKNRPDYRFESLKLIVEFDGNQHYQDAAVIVRDRKKDRVYTAMGYRVLRIPYFVQMAQALLQECFGAPIVYRQVYPHGFIDAKAVLPANFCELGVQRFMADLVRFSAYRAGILQSLREKVAEKGDVDLVVPPSLRAWLLDKAA